MVPTGTLHAGRDVVIIALCQTDHQDRVALFFGKRSQRSYQVTDFQMLDLAGRAAQGRFVFAPIDGGALTGSATDLTDIFIVQDTKKPRSQIRSHLPELKLPERSRQAFLDEVVGVDRIMRQAARIS